MWNECAVPVAQAQCKLKRRFRSGETDAVAQSKRERRRLSGLRRLQMSYLYLELRRCRFDALVTPAGLRIESLTLLDSVRTKIKYDILSSRTGIESRAAINLEMVVVRRLDLDSGC